MITYSKFRPTGCDTAGLGCDDQQDWLVAPVTVNRDSDCLTRSNWAVVTDDLAEHDPMVDGEHSMQIHRFGHWACGWFEVCLVKPGSAAAACAEKWESALADYPVASDDHFSNLEHQEAADYWDHASLRQRRDECKRAGVSRFAAYLPFGKVPDRLYEHLRESA